MGALDALHTRSTRASVDTTTARSLAGAPTNRATGSTLSSFEPTYNKHPCSWSYSHSQPAKCEYARNSGKVGKQYDDQITIRTLLFQHWIVAERQ